MQTNAGRSKEYVVLEKDPSAARNAPREKESRDGKSRRSSTKRFQWRCAHAQQRLAATARGIHVKKGLTSCYRRRRHSC